MKEYNNTYSSDKLYLTTSPPSCMLNIALFPREKQDLFLCSTAA